MQLGKYLSNRFPENANESLSIQKSIISTNEQVMA